MGTPEWEYKGFKCRIEMDYEDDNMKAWHYIVKPNGVEIVAQISPYDRDPKTVEMYIDAGFPGRRCIGNCSFNQNQDSLKDLLSENSN